MAELDDLIEDPTARTSRRKVLVGVAWAVPVVMAVGATPASATSATSASVTLQTTRAYIRKEDVAQFPFKGTGPARATITVTSGNRSQSVTAGQQGNWSMKFDASSLADGVNLAFTATATGTTSSQTITITKDTEAPALTLGQSAAAAASGTISGSMGQKSSPTADKPVTVSFSVGAPTKRKLTQGRGTWSLTWTGASAGTITVQQKDGAGNKTTLTCAIT